MALEPIQSSRSAGAAAEIDRVYGRGYFHGEGSGFAREGYERVHATWVHWMPFVRGECGAGARWLDLGCAYGFLVAEAREAGFRAFGVDASSFAVGQAEAQGIPAAGLLARALADALPLADASVDVVSAFDVLEHLTEPERALDEVARILRPGGLHLASTPDPIWFDRVEHTHVSEWVPARWIEAIERRGFGVAHRFCQAQYNLEMVARRSGPPPAIGFEDLGKAEPILALCGEGRLSAALRSGFGALDDGRRRVVSPGAVVHLLNRGGSPLRLRIRLRWSAPTASVLRLDDRVLARLPLDAAAPSTVEGLLPSGGHCLTITPDAGWGWLESLEVEAVQGDPAELRRTLPFDLHGRYALAAEVIDRLGLSSDSVLDVGGAMGMGRGHLAWVGDFLPNADAWVVDPRAVDHARHVQADATAQLPMADRASAVVLATDVLEHVPAGARAHWLEEVWRVTGRVLLLANPFATPGASEADRYLFELIRSRWGYAHPFLQEHLENGLPDLPGVVAFFRDRGASVSVLPSGNLANWLLLQTLNATLSHPEQDTTYALANAAFNDAIGVRDAVPPTYRHLLVIDRTGADHTVLLGDLLASGTPDPGPTLAALAVAGELVGAGAAGERP